jgi:uncharacterized protein with HEPN domain
MKKEYRDYQDDIINAITKAEQFIGRMSFEDFEKDEKTIFAVVRALEILGEAAKKLPPSLKNKYPKIPWREISGMRNKLIHEYFGVNLRVVWDTVKKDIPTIKPFLLEIFEEENN